MGLCTEKMKKRKGWREWLKRKAWSRDPGGCKESARRCLGLKVRTHAFKINIMQM